jgi:hypothetical protein
MRSADLERQLETETIALNRWLYEESVGRPVDEQGYAAPAAALAGLYARLLDEADDTLHRFFALENRAEARIVPFDQRLAEARDAALTLPEFHSSEGPLTWRNWKAFEREIDDAARLAEAFERMVELSAKTTPALEARLAQARADYASHGLTPVHTFAWREGTTPEALRALLLSMGQKCREPFQAALDALSQSVFGRNAGPAELRALYLNRMYEPNARLFGEKEKKREKERGAAQSADSTVKLIRETQAVFREMGFDLSGVPVDVENRPRKYPGAFCFPVAIPRDVRVSVRIASPHHLVDMLYHEFGHAAHFSGIRADLPFVERYWIHSGAHESFSTLFESLLREPAFLRAQFGFDDEAVRRLMEFARFKTLLTGTWLAASALTSVEGWLENLPWPEIEARYAAHMRNFTGVPMPSGFARLEPFTAAQSVYPAGYVIASVRVAHWTKRLRELGGEAWWRSPAAQADIREKIGAGGTVRFPEGWGEVELLIPLNTEH